MNLYLVKAAGVVGWDETSAAVVRATDATAAKLAVDAHVNQWNSEHVPSANGWRAARVSTKGPAAVILTTQQ
jgi:hypothetical protein